ncbi:NEW3 domain-containing protein [Streptomyces pathocidini]|uniref:glycoside hydrolase family 38 N-terminal domain-containing protein n=1 Tax=Streptomyces pathocidini TaxID=1650571 RepID=UPI00340CFCB3
MRITKVDSTQCFVKDGEHTRQVLLVEVEYVPNAGLELTVSGRDANGARPVAVECDERGRARVEIPMVCEQPPGTRCPIRVDGRNTGPEQPRSAIRKAEFEVAEPGWTMFMVSHFHYDPVWWNTQAAYTTTWDEADDTGRGMPSRTFDSRGQSGFSLIRAHSDLARRDPEYTFVLAEIDYLKPYWDAHPEERAFLRELLRQGRIEIMGGTYNEPNTNLTGAEATIRNALYGAGFQRDIMGADPATAWQLDAFGHDPQFPGLMADAGLTSSSWARGPFHQWGPTMRKWGDDYKPPTAMQFPAEFSWMAPSGRSLLTSYMVNHYMAGWKIDSAPDLAGAEEAAYRLFQQLQSVALTRNVLLPVGGDYSPPCRWVMDIHRDWNERYVWPRFVSGLPRDFFAAVRAELAESGRTPSPQTRDMNPVYTGKDVSYIDTKQAQRYGETLLADAEAWATLAYLLTGAHYPDAALDKAWRQLVYGAHHDAITGSESDQVYIDLLTGWRELVDIAEEVGADATAAIAELVEPAEAAQGAPASDLVVFNPASWSRRDVLTVADTGLVPVDEDGAPLPAVAEDGRLQVVVDGVPGVGYRALRLTAGTAEAWLPDGGGAGFTIGNEFYEVTVDPARGGGVTRLRDLRSGRELVREGEVGNEIVVHEEYPTHPEYGEGPWHLVPNGTIAARSGDRPAEVLVEHSPAGSRITVTVDLGVCRAVQRLHLWAGVARLDVTTTVDGFDGADRLIRLRWPSAVRGGLPVSEVADAVVGRGFGFTDVDSKHHPFTLDNPANTWFGIGSTARVALSSRDGGRRATRAIGVAELVFPSWDEAGSTGAELAAALVRAGVTATTTIAEGSRYGLLDTDSNLPDVRFAVGSPDRNPVVAEALSRTPGAESALREQLARDGAARLWLAPRRSLREEWVADADLRDLGRLPLLVVAGATAEGDAKAVADLVTDLEDAVIEAAAYGDSPGAAPEDDWDGASLAVLNRGMPGFAVDTSGDLHLSLMRSCTGWPSGIWIDPPRRTAPDGSAFQLQHWTHAFDYSVVGGEGDWRDLELPRHGHAFNHPLTAVVRDGDTVASDGRARLPRSYELLSVRPEGRVVLDAVKPAGAPLARGLDEPSDPARGLVVRLHETTGRPVTARIAGPVAFAGAHSADLLETERAELPTDEDGAAYAEVGGFEVATVLAVPAPATGPASDAAPAETVPQRYEHEPAQPVFTRYWLHNSGPAPRGNLPVAVHLAPVALTADGPVAATVKVASELTDTSVSGEVRLAVPPGWQVSPPALPYALGPGGYLLADVTVTPPADAVPGRYWLTAEVGHRGQRFADATALDVPGEAGDGTADGRHGPSLTAELADGRVTVRRGERTSAAVLLRNTTRGTVDGQVWAVSAWGTWQGVAPSCQGFTVPGGAAAEVRVEIDASAIPVGEYWLMAKVAWHGSVAYTPAIPLEVTA